MKYFICFLALCAGIVSNEAFSTVDCSEISLLDGTYRFTSYDDSYDESEGGSGATVLMDLERINNPELPSIFSVLHVTPLDGDEYYMDHLSRNGSIMLVPASVMFPEGVDGISGDACLFSFASSPPSFILIEEVSGDSDLLVLGTPTRLVAILKRVEEDGN